MHQSRNIIRRCIVSEVRGAIRYSRPKRMASSCYECLESFGDLVPTRLAAHFANRVLKTPSVFKIFPAHFHFRIMNKWVW